MLHKRTHRSWRPPEYAQHSIKHMIRSVHLLVSSISVAMNDEKASNPQLISMTMSLDTVKANGY